MHKTLKRGATDLRITLAKSLLTHVARLLFEFGLNRNELIGILTRIPEKNSTPNTAKQTKHETELGWWSYARILSHWHHNPEFVDATGGPARLRLRGRGPSFESLVRRALPGRQPAVILRKLTELGALERTAGGTVLPANRHLVAHKKNHTTLLRALETLEALSSTMHRNLFARGSKSRSRSLFERSAVSEKFDMRQLRRLNGIVRTQGQSMLEFIDEWMSRHETVGRRRGKPGYVGVGMYLYVGDRESGKPS